MHCPAFEKMYNQVKRGLIEFGNAVVKYEHPVHTDKDGNIIEEGSLAL